MRSRPLLLIALIGLLFAIGWLVRSEIDVGFSSESIHTWVEGLGWYAPAIFVLLVTFRHFILLPSSSLWLLAGGLLFPVSLATLVGGLGIFLSSLLWFLLARGLGRDWVRPRLGRRFEELEPQLESSGPWIIGFTTAHPISPITGFHMIAGVATVPVMGFLLAVALGSPTRALACSYFGSTLLDVGSREFYTATGLITAATLIPLLHPGVRARIFRRGAVLDRDASDPGG